MRKMPNQEPIIIRASDLRKLHFCQRKAWLDIHGDVAERDLPTEGLMMRLIGGVTHEEEVHEATTHEIRQHVVRSWREGVEMTRMSMQQGTRGIIGAFLEAEFEMGTQRILVRGKVDRIVPRRLSGHTVYAPIEIKHYGKVTVPDELQLDCYTWLLEQNQGIRPPAEFWMGRGVDGRPAQRLRHQYDETRLMRAFELLLQYHLNEADEPDVYIDSRCKQCHWFSACRKEAAATYDLSLINRLRRDSREELLAADVQTLNQLIEIDFTQLRQIKGIKSTAEQFHAQARAWVEDRPIFYREPSSLCVGNVWHVDTEYYPNYATNGYEVWSIGWSRGDEPPSIILVADGQSENELTLPNGQQVLVVPTADDAWHLFAEIVGQDEAPIFHWSPADKTALGKKAPQIVIDRIVNRFTDLERHFVKSVQLPVYSTSIKDIAEYLGFTWSGHAHWFAAFRDYETWLSSGDETALTRTCAYQSDDVSALAVVCRWMIDNYPGQSE
jgi:predicted RecB family nuclease